MNINEMRTIVRCDLRDEDAMNYRWTDAQLDRHISHAVRDLSEAIPDEQKIIKATTPSSHMLNISDLTDRISIHAVEYPIDLFPPRYQRFALCGNALLLFGRDIPDGSNAYVFYGKLHVLDASGSTIPVRYDDLVSLGATAYAAYEWASYAINRVNLGGTQTASQLLTWGKDRLVDFRSRLHTLARTNRVRAGSLYSAYYPPVHRAADPGP